MEGYALYRIDSSTKQIELSVVSDFFPENLSRSSINVLTNALMNRLHSDDSRTRSVFADVDTEATFTIQFPGKDIIDNSDLEDALLAVKMICYYSTITIKLEDTSNIFLLCLLTDNQSVIELFRFEISSFFNDHILIKKLKNFTSETEIDEYLKFWYHHCSEFIINCISSIPVDQLAPILFLSLSNKPYAIKTSHGDGVVPETVKTQLEKFIRCCQLDFFQTEPESTNLMTTSNADEQVILVTPKSEENKEKTANFDNYNVTCSIGNTADFCKSWAKTLQQNSLTDSLTLRQLIENFKLRAIQDMNSFKRLLKLAELNYYALYQSYKFLKKSGNDILLIEFAKQEIDSLEKNKDMDNVISCLSDFISSK